MKIFKPFEQITQFNKTTILTGWFVLLISFWVVCSFGETHMFPTPQQVLSGFADLWYGGLVVHITSSLALFTTAVLISVFTSLILAYSYSIPAIKPMGMFTSKLRYLPLTGIAFYIAIVVSDARWIQVWVLVAFMTTFLTTSLISMIEDIPEVEFDHAKTLGMNRWEILWEVVIKGRLDYVIELVRQNLAIVWMMLVSIESILAAAGGLGFLIKNNDKLGDSGKVIALQIIIVLIGLTLDFLLTKIRKITFRYSDF